MMNHMMPYDMMNGGIPILWLVIGFLLGLILMAVVAWLLTRWRNEQRSYHAQHVPHNSYHTYEQGYQPPQPAPEAYQEGGYSYPYPQPSHEQPMVQHQQED